MSKNSNLGGSSNMRTQIQNLWQAINTIETGGGGGGTGNMNYIGGSTTVGQHYKATSTTGLNCDKSSIIENSTDFTFGNKNLGAIGIISGDSFVKSGGSNQQYLMADGSSLTYSGNSGNSNYYLFLNGTGGTTPADGYITYNQNPFQFQSTMIYISHLTRDGIDIEVFFKQLTILSEVYIQDQSTSKFMQFNITGPPTITVGQNVAIPVVLRTGNTTALAPNRQIMISFFTNTIEIDTRLSTLETKTQNQSAVSNQTDFAGTIQADTIQIRASSPNLHLMSDGSTRDITTVTNGGPVGGQSLVKIGYGTNPSIQLNSVSAFNGVGLTLNNGNISFSNTATLSNAGILTGLSLVSNGTAPNYSLKSIEAGTAISLIDNSDVITISNTSPASGISLANAGSGTSLISSTSANPNFRTKSITQGSGISISDVSNNLTISTTTPYLPLTGGTMAGTVNMNNNLITGLQRLTFNTSSTAIGSSAGLTSQGTNSVAVGSGCGQTSQGNESLAIGYNSGLSNQLGSSVAVGRGCGQVSQGALCVALGNVAGTTSQSTASIAIGNQAGATTQGGASESCVAIGNFTGNDNQGGFSVAIGKEAGRVTQGANCVAIGNQAGRNSQSPNSIVFNASGAVLDSTTTGLFIKPVRNEFNTNTILYNSTSGELTYSEMGSYLPELSPDYKPNIWYYITTTSTFIGGVFNNSVQITAIGGTLTQIATANTNWRTRKSGRINCPTLSVADGQRSGFIGTATFPAIYSGSGWFFSFDFSITDTNVATTACTRMFVGFGITTTAPALATGVAINSLQNMIGIGHDNGDSVLSFYSRGPTVGTANGNKIATTFSCATPSTKIFTATFYSPTNSDDIMIKLYDQETRTSAYQTFTLAGTLTPITTSPLIPVWVRAMAPVSGGAITNSAQLGLNGFKWYTL